MTLKNFKKKKQSIPHNNNKRESDSAHVSKHLPKEVVVLFKVPKRAKQRERERERERERRPRLRRGALSPNERTRVFIISIIISLREKDFDFLLAISYRTMTMMMMIRVVHSRRVQKFPSDDDVKRDTKRKTARAAERRQGRDVIITGSKRPLVVRAVGEKSGEGNESKGEGDDAAAATSSATSLSSSSSSSSSAVHHHQSNEDVEFDFSAIGKNELATKEEGKTREDKEEDKEETILDPLSPSLPRLTKPFNRSPRVGF